MAKVAADIFESTQKKIESAQLVDKQFQSHFQASLGDLKYILYSLKENKIKIKSTKPTTKESPTDAFNDCNDAQSKPPQQKKTRERTKRCTVVLHKNKNSQSSGSLNSLKDDLIENSSSSKRSRRAHAQTSDEQLPQDNSTMRRTRLRSQMNLREQISKEVSPPLAKRRKTRGKKTAGSSLEKEIQDSKIENKENSSVPKSKRFVQKQIENFEKLKKDAEKKDDEVTFLGVVTKHTRLKATPKAVPQVAAIQKNKEVSSSSSAEIQTGNTIVHKQSPEEAEIQKHKELLKRQAKEVVVNKKKEDILKATSEETRRKRENKIQKVAAAREATEREKALQAAKAEKEKEEKMLQIAAEKEKIKAEKLKKKLQMQQKQQEIEERRKREEEARMAKLREQEEEHKRILANKEREMDLQKQQKAAELRLAEAEKAKLQSQTSKLNKLAAVNNAEAKLQQAAKHLTPKSKDNYGIEDAKSDDDSSDNESRPKKPIPLWAQPKNRHHLVVVSSLLPKEIWPLFMECSSDPDVRQMFPGVPVMKRTRTSSAVWTTPPLRLHDTPNKNLF